MNNEGLLRLVEERRESFRTLGQCLDCTHFRDDTGILRKERVFPGQEGDLPWSLCGSLGLPVVRLVPKECPDKKDK